jgi:exodeoxyribonuclease VII small subunit
MSPKPKSEKSQVLTEQISTQDRLSFEEALGALEVVITELEKDDLSLDRALTIFEQGIGLMRQCDAKLGSAQGKMKELLKGENGEFVEKVLGDSLESFLNRE